MNTVLFIKEGGSLSEGKSIYPQNRKTYNFIV